MVFRVSVFVFQFFFVVSGLHLVFESTCPNNICKVYSGILFQQQTKHDVTKEKREILLRLTESSEKLAL